ncbi:hypothetical protein D068_cds41440 [Bacillus atrophaeus UCMB-5137]|nr:hypothetical protein D068_cds41440 [Bacillus atrophaeus UCMB-5137]
MQFFFEFSHHKETITEYALTNAFSYRGILNEKMDSGGFCDDVDVVFQRGGEFEGV